MEQTEGKKGKQAYNDLFRLLFLDLDGTDFYQSINLFQPISIQLFRLMEQFQHNQPQQNEEFLQSTINPEQNIQHNSLELQNRSNQQKQHQIQPVQLQIRSHNQHNEEQTHEVDQTRRYEEQPEILQHEQQQLPLDQGEGQEQANLRARQGDLNGQDRSDQTMQIEDPQDGQQIEKNQVERVERDSKDDHYQGDINQKDEIQKQAELENQIKNLEENDPRENKNDQIQVKMENQFDWGEQEKCQPRKRSISQFFLNKMADLKENSSDFSEIKKGEKKGKIQKRMGVGQKINQVDIWEGVREIMLEKSRLSDKGKSKNLNILPSIKKGQSEKVAIEDTKSGEKLKLKQKKKQIVNNINQMSKIILQKMRRWRKENKDIDERRNNKIQMEKQIRNQVKQKSTQEKILIKKIQAQNIQKGIKTSKIQKTEKTPVRTSKTEKTEKSKQKREKNNKDDIKKEVKLIQAKHEQVQEGFTLQRSYNSVQYRSEKQKLMRRKLFENRIKQIPVNVSSSKKLLREIQIDRSQNPLKYKILRRKGFSDEQIVKMQKQVNIVDPKKIGAKYLQGLREKNKSNDLRRYMSQQSILLLKKNERHYKPIYPIYFEEIQKNSSLKLKKENF